MIFTSSDFLWIRGQQHQIFFCRRTNWWYRSWHKIILQDSLRPKPKVKETLCFHPPTTSFSVNIVYTIYTYVMLAFFFFLLPLKPFSSLTYLLNFISHTTPKSDDSWYCEYYTTWVHIYNSNNFNWVTITSFFLFWIRLFK